MNTILIFSSLPTLFANQNVDIQSEQLQEENSTPSIEIISSPQRKIPRRFLSIGNKSKIATNGDNTLYAGYLCELTTIPVEPLSFPQVVPESEGAFWLIADSNTIIYAEVIESNLSRKRGPYQLNTENLVGRPYGSMGKVNNDLIIAYKGNFDSEDEIYRERERINSDADSELGSKVSPTASIYKQFKKSSVLVLKSVGYVVFLDRASTVVPRYIMARAYDGDDAPLSKPRLVSDPALDITEFLFGIQLDSSEIVFFYNAILEKTKISYYAIFNADLSGKVESTPIISPNENSYIVEHLTGATPVSRGKFAVSITHNATGNFFPYYGVYDAQGNAKIDLTKVNNENQGDNYLARIASPENRPLLFLTWWNNETGLNSKSFDLEDRSTLIDQFVVTNDTSEVIASTISPFSAREFGIFWPSPRDNYKIYRRTFELSALHLPLPTGSKS